MTESTLSATAAPFVALGQQNNAAERITQSSAHAARAAELARAKVTLNSALRHFPDFPIPGIDFVDILPLFADPILQETLLSALEMEVVNSFPTRPDVIVALDARGFLFGPGLALRLGARFAPVRKQGKIPGPTVTASYKKEYGEDFFQMQTDAIAPGQTALIVDDIIATGKLVLVFQDDDEL
jgi:adenine phosphoribosyltransferase